MWGCANLRGQLNQQIASHYPATCSVANVMMIGVLIILLLTGALPLVNGQQAVLVYLTLGMNSTITTNNTEILITDIGEDAADGLPSLTCHTDLTACCRNIDTVDGIPAGEWYYPDGSLVLSNADAPEDDPFYRVRNAPQVTRLARRENADNTLGPTGSYCCVIPTTGGEMIFCANIVLCPSLPSPTNGTISYSDPTLGAGTVVTYTCDDGYAPTRGNIIRLCQNESTWSGSPPTCDVPAPQVSVSFPPPPLNAGGPITLTCTITVDSAVNVNATVNVTWEISTNSGPIVSNSTATGSVPTFTDNLTIEILTLNYTGVTCTASVSIVGSFANSPEGSDQVILTIEVPTPPVLTIDITGGTVAGSTLSVLCTATPPTPLVRPPVVSWVDVNVSDPDVTVTESTLGPASGAMLTFSPLRASHGMQYTCAAEYDIPEANLPDEQVTTSTTIYVQIPPAQSVVLTASRPAPYYEGTTGLVITCEVTPNSTGVDTDITVNRPFTGPALSGSRAMVEATGDTASTLTISPLARSDSGVYICSPTVSSAVNSNYILTSDPIMELFNLMVTDLPAPIVSITPSTIQAVTGENVSFSCSVNVVEFLASSPSILWTTDSTGQSLDAVSNESTSILSLELLRTSNAEQYTCTATVNIPDIVIIKGENKINLTVTISPPTVTLTTIQPVEHGTNHNLSCVASYSFNVDTGVNVLYFWSGPSGDLGNSEAFAIFTTSTGSFLTLTPVDQPSVSNGNYSCTVTVQPDDDTLINEGSNTGTISLDVQDPPLPMVVIEVPMRDGRCGQVTSITCSASVQDNFVSSPVVSWFGPDNQTADADETLGFDSMTPGEYTCQACVTVESVNIFDHCNTQAVNITNEEPASVTSLSCLDNPSSSNTLEVVWSPPAGQTVLSYQVEVRDYRLSGEEVTTVTVTDNEINAASTVVGSLAPGVRYLVSVMAISGTGCGSEQTVDCYTEELEPPPVTGVNVARTSGTDMTVSWGPINEVQAKGFIIFTVTYTAFAGSRNKRQASQAVTVPGDRSSVEITGLDPAAQYDIIVTAESGGGTSISQPVTALQTSLFQLRLLNINNCPEWVERNGRIESVTNAFATAVETHCQCGFFSSLIAAPSFRCFPESNTAVTYRAQLADQGLLSAIESWIRESGLLLIQNVFISIDQSCQVGISSYADTECNSETPSPDGSSTGSIVGGVIGGVVFILVITSVIVVVLIIGIKRRKAFHKRDVFELPSVSLRGLTMRSQSEGQKGCCCHKCFT